MTKEEFSSMLDYAYSSIKETLIKKNESYGFSVFSGDITWNIIGNVTRLGDKYRRYEHLVKEYVKTGKFDTPFGESLEDSLKDILGYALIGNVILASDSNFCSANSNQS